MRNYKSLIILLFVLVAGFSANAQDNISPERKRAIDSLALEKIRDLGTYISRVGNTDTEFSEANRIIDRALELFAPGSEMGVSSLYSSDIKYYTIRKYFERLMALNYDKVSIQWYNIEYVSDLELGPDGRYVGVITIYQSFEGTGADGLQYRDTTKKDITVYVERKSTQIAGREIEFWDVLLGDIRVTETSV